MPKMEVEPGIEIYYEEAGTGDKYIISYMMDLPPICSTRAMAEHGYHVFLLMNRGIGKSTHLTCDYGTEWYNKFADDVVAFADKMGIDKFVYMGLSHGAGTGWHVALRHPDRLIALVAMCGGPHNLDEGSWSFRSAKLAGKKFPNPDPEEKDEAILRRMAKNADYYREIKENQTPEEAKLNYGRPLAHLGTEEKVQEALRTIQTPTLMIGCLEDPIARPDLMLRTAQCIPNGKTILYSGFGHSAPYYRIVEEVTSEVCFFLNNVRENDGKVYQKVVEA